MVFMFKIWLKRISGLFLVLLAVMPLWACSAEPESCALCDSAAYHAPCLVSLSTGEVGELTVYDPHPVIPGQIAQEQTGGSFRFLNCLGLMGTRDTSSWKTRLYVPRDADAMRGSYFCKSCRALLKDCGDAGFVLADLHTPDAPAVYPIEDGAAYTLRCYSVTVVLDQDSGDYRITVQGEKHF